MFICRITEIPNDTHPHRHHHGLDSDDTKVGFGWNSEIIANVFLGSNVLNLVLKTQFTCVVSPL